MIFTAPSMLRWANYNLTDLFKKDMIICLIQTRIFLYGYK